MHRKYLRWIVTSALAILAACSRDVPLAPSVTMADGSEPTASYAAATWASSLRMRVGESLTLQPSPVLRRSRNLSWQSSNSKIVAVNSSGTVRAYRTGSATITAIASGVSQRFSVAVTTDAPDIVRFELTPASGVVLSPGSTLQFTAVATWSDGTQRNVAVGYTATGGAVTQNGLYTAGQGAGDFLVIATCACGLSDSAHVRVNVPARLEKLTIDPKAITLQPSAPLQFLAAAVWSSGETDLPALAWTATDGGISAAGLYVAPTREGTYRVIVSAAGGTVADTAVVTVARQTGPPPVAVVTEFKLNPATGSVLTPGQTRQFSTAVTWSDGVGHAVTVSYAATGGSITPNGIFTAGSDAGTFRVIAKCSCGLSDTAQVQVAATAPQLQSLTVGPKLVIIQTSASQRFTLTARWNTGATNVPSVQWVTDGGTISQSGTYLAPSSPGTYMVAAVYDGGAVWDTARVVVQASGSSGPGSGGGGGTPTPVVTGFTLNPATGVVLVPGGTRQFSTTATWSDGATRAVSVTYSATGGTITGNGLFTAGSIAGTFMVIANCSCGLADTAQVRVSAPAQLQKLTVSPKTVTLESGSSQQFSVSANWSTGATDVPPVTWSATGGSVSASGNYVAPASAGTYRVVVAHNGGTVRDTALVTVTAGNSSGSGTGGVSLNGFADHLPGGVGLQFVLDSRFGNMLSGERVNSDGLAYVWNGRNVTVSGAPWGNAAFETYYGGNDAGNGEGGAKIWANGGPYRRMYFALSMWVSPDYSVHTNGEKFFYPIVVTNGQPTGSTCFEWFLTGSESARGATFSLGVDAQIGLGRIYQPQAKLRKGVWQTVEFYVVMNTPGKSDGVWQAWIDGQMVVDRNDMRYSNASTQSLFEGMRFDGTRGGGPSEVLTPAGGQVRRYNRLAFFGSVN